MTNYYQIADIFVLPSLSESFGSVLVQAGASETPCTVTATTGAKEIIKDGYNGLLVPINNANLLADKILYLLNNPEKAKQIGENGRKLVIEKYNNNTEKIIKLWKNLVF